MYLQYFSEKDFKIFTCTFEGYNLFSKFEPYVVPIVTPICSSNVLSVGVYTYISREHIKSPNSIINVPDDIDVLECATHIIIGSQIIIDNNNDAKNIVTDKIVLTMLLLLLMLIRWILNNKTQLHFQCTLNDILPADIDYSRVMLNQFILDNQVKCHWSEWILYLSANCHYVTSDNLWLPGLGILFYGDRQFFRCLLLAVLSSNSYSCCFFNLDA